MTPDELFTRVHRQRAEMIASDLAMDALMAALPPELQQQWLKALQSLRTKRAQALQAAKADPASVAQAEEFVARRIQRLEAARDQGNQTSS
ncbi:MAG: hypothetical protein AB7P37_03335 [Ramlibacter sp.]